MVAAVFEVCLYFGFLSLYTTLVCVAGSQLEKLRAALLDIRQTHGTSLQYCVGETDERGAAGHNHTNSKQFRHMQEQLNNCIRHHQEIMRWGKNRSLNLQIRIITFSNETKCAFCCTIFHCFRYMAILEDTINIPLCGLFLLTLSTLCFDAFSAVTVQYALKYSRHSVTTRIHTSWFVRY